MGTRILMGVLLAILAGSIYVGYAGWNSTEHVDLPASAYVAMGFGIVFTLLVGCGLMALVFYSHHHGYDDQVGHGTKPEP
jgi:drug/metabolite transporter (DMT)-like permease